METKQQVTKKFIIGVILIVVSLILGKLVLIPLFLFPGEAGWAKAMFWAYIGSWILILVGMLLAGIEGYKLAMHRYREIKNKSISTVKRGGKKVGEHSVKAAKTVGRTSKKAVDKVSEKGRNAKKRIVRHHRKVRLKKK